MYLLSAEDGLIGTVRQDILSNEADFVKNTLAVNFNLVSSPCFRFVVFFIVNKLLQKNPEKAHLLQNISF